jgi:heterodisulfide reductase subunit A
MKPTSASTVRTDRKVGVYLCHCGGNISDHVDVEQLAQQVQQLPGVAVVRTNTFMCSDPGQELIQKDIKNGRIDRVVVASCAPSLHELTFRNAIKRAGMNPYLYEHANIREQVSWVHHGRQATAKAADLVAAAAAKTAELEPLEPIRVPAQKHAVVIGAGIAGMRAAIDLSRAGLGVTLVEQSSWLGGRVAQLGRLAPAGDTAENVIRALYQQICAEDGIQVLTDTRVAGCQGYVGNFSLTLKTLPADPQARDAPEGTYVPFAGLRPANPQARPAQFSLETGAVVMATGFKPYTPRTGEYGYGKMDEVVTLPELIRGMPQSDETGGMMTFKGRPIRRLAFIHCVGSRQIPGIHDPQEDGRLNEYCSRTCCSATLGAAVALREHWPETQVFDFYRDIRTYGRGQEALYEQAAQQRVLFFRYEADSPPVVHRSLGGQFPLRVEVKDTLTFGENVSAAVDLVVLAVGMQASPIDDLVEMMKLPRGMDGFLQEVHPKLRPVELANTGILLAGTCQAPKDISESCSAAQAAAVKTSALLAKGYIEIDPYVAQVDAQRCSGEGRCAQLCPVQGAVRLEPTGGSDPAAPRAQINPALCTGCGICVAECPHQAIDINGWTLKQYEAMVDAILAA